MECEGNVLHALPSLIFTHNAAKLYTDVILTTRGNSAPKSLCMSAGKIAFAAIPFCCESKVLAF